jgi:hypothetical protein
MARGWLSLRIGLSAAETGCKRPGVPAGTRSALGARRKATLPKTVVCLLAAFLLVWQAPIEV